MFASIDPSSSSLANLVGPSPGLTIIGLHYLGMESRHILVLYLAILAICSQPILLLSLGELQVQNEASLLSMTSVCFAGELRGEAR